MLPHSQKALHDEEMQQTGEIVEGMTTIAKISGDIQEGVNADDEKLQQTSH